MAQFIYDVFNINLPIETYSDEGKYYHLVVKFLEI